MTKDLQALLYLVRLGIGGDTESGFDFTGADWRNLVDSSFAQGVPAIAADGLQKLYESNSSLELTLDSPEFETLKYEWFGSLFQTEGDYANHRQKAAELTRLFAEAGFRSCILKGLSNALLYPNPSHRQCGDIDIWVEGGRRRVLEFLRGKYKVGDTVIHHAHVEVFKDVSVEVHYLPAWLYNPIANRKLQRFFKTESDAQFSNMSACGFATPLPKFNQVYNAVHIYKHYFQEEFTLKNLVDYYCILQHSSAEDRREAFCVLKQVGLGKFTGWLMGRLERDLGLPPELALCKSSASDTCHRPFGELLCLLPWKLWHWFARKSY